MTHSRNTAAASIGQQVQPAIDVLAVSGRRQPGELELDDRQRRDQQRDNARGFPAVAKQMVLHVPWVLGVVAFRLKQLQALRCNTRQPLGRDRLDADDRPVG
jgi:hypothetical protein